MKKTFTDEQIVGIIRGFESSLPVVETREAGFAREKSVQTTRQSSHRYRAEGAFDIDSRLGCERLTGFEKRKR